MSTDHFEEKKDGEDDEDEGSAKKPMPRECKWLRWWRKKWPASGDLQSRVQEDKEKNPKTEPDKDPDEADKKPDTTCVGEHDRAAKTKDRDMDMLGGGTFGSQHKVQV